MVAMLSFTSNCLQELGFIVSPAVVLIGINPTIQACAFRPVTVDIQTVMGMEKPHGVTHLGRCECLRSSDDRAVLADVARGYRRIAALPRADDPVRWRLAQTRLISVLRKAGADGVRLDARLARLRAIDPLVGTADAGP